MARSDALLAVAARQQAVAWALPTALLAAWGCSDEPDPPRTSFTQLRTLPTTDPSGCTWQPPVIQGFVKPSDLKESSGVAASRIHPGYLWVHNDSGAKPLVYLLTPDGQLRLTLHLDGAPHTDWEDMALGPCPPQLAAGSPGQPGDCLWLADIGDNAEGRKNVEIIVVGEPTALPDPLQAPPEFEVAKGGWRSVELSYPDGPHNAEALALLPGGWALILTKRDDGNSALYRAAVLKAIADKDEKIKAEPLGLLNLKVPGVASGERLRVTAADYDSASDRLAVRTYASIQLFAGGQLLVSASPPEVAQQVANWQGLLVPSPAEPQGEALSFQGATRWIALSEGPAAKIYSGSCTAP